MQKLAPADLQRVIWQLRDDDAARPAPAGWTCRDCGIGGEYRTRDAAKCAAYMGSKFERGLHGVCITCDKPEDEHHYAARFCFRYLSTCSGPGVCKNCGRPEKSHHGSQKYCYGRHFFSYCCLCHAHRYSSDPLCEHCAKRWMYLREFEAAQAQDDGGDGGDITGAQFLKRIQASRTPAEFGDDDVGKPIPELWVEGRQFYRDPTSKFAEDEFVVAFRSNGSRQLGRIINDNGDGSFDILVSRSGGESGNGQCRTDAAQDIGKIARTTVGWAFRQRFDVLTVRALLQSSDGIKTLVSLVKQGNFPSSCTDHTGASSFFDGGGRLKLDVSMQTREMSASGELPGAGSRRNTPNLLSMRTIASGLSSLYGIIAALDVSGHTLLERIPVKELVAIKSLVFLGCVGCRRLVSPPAGIAEQGGFAVMEFLRLARPEEGGVFNNTIELIMIGRAESGKTSVITSLKQGKAGKINEDQRTVGIDLSRWDLGGSPDVSGLTFNIRDLAGEVVYRLSHQYFLVKKAIFVLVWRVIPKISCELDTFEEEVSDMVTDWIESVQLRVPGARIFVVATHIDCAHESEVERQCKWVKSLIQERVKELEQDELVTGISAPIVWKDGDSLRVNCLDGAGVEEMRLQLIEMAHGLPWWQEGIPGCYMNLKEKLAEYRQERTWISWPEYTALATSCGVVGNHLEIATRLLNDDATLTYFGQFPKREVDHGISKLKRAVDLARAVQGGQHVLKRDQNLDIEGAKPLTEPHTSTLPEDQQVGNFVYIDPKWMIDAYKGLIRHNRNSLLDFFVSDKVTLSDDERNTWLVRIRRLAAFGILHRELIPFLWPGGLEGLPQTYWEWARSQKEGELWPRPMASRQEDYDRVLEFLECSDMLNLVNEFEYVAPALLAGPHNQRLDPRAFEPPFDDTVKKSVSVPHLPAGFFNKLLVKLRRRNSHMDFSSFGAALYESGLKTQLFLTQSRTEAVDGRKRARVTLHIFTMTKAQMDQIVQHLCELFKFYPGMCGIHKNGTIFNLEAWKDKIIRIIGWLSDDENAAFKQGVEPVQVRFIQAASIDPGDAVEIRELRVHDEDKESIDSRWKLPVGAFGLKFEVVDGSKDGNLIILKPPDPAMLEANKLDLTIAFTFASLPDHIRDSMSRQFKDELQDQMERKQKQDQTLKIRNALLETAKGDIEALKLQLTKVKTGSLLFPKANVSARVHPPNAYLKQGDVVMLLDTAVTPFLLGRELTGKGRIQFKNKLVPDLKLKTSWPADNKFTVVRSESDDEVSLQVPVAMRDALSQLIQSELDLQLETWQRKEIEPAALSKLLQPFRRQIERVCKGILACHASAIAGKEIFEHESLKQGDIVLLSQSAVASLLLGQNLTNRSNEESSELYGFKMRLPSELKLRASTAVDRFEIARNELVSAQEVMIRLPAPIQDPVLLILQEEINREIKELKQKESEYSALQKEAAVHAARIEETRHHLAKVRDATLPVPRKGEFLFQELGKEKVFKGRVELVNTEDKQTFAKRLKDMIQAEEVLTIDASDSTVEWDQKDTDRMRVVIVCVDRFFCTDEKALQKFRAAVKAGLAIFPVICPGYVIKDFACWWPVNMPELEEYIHYFDMRDMLSEDNVARDRCRRTAEVQLLPQIKAALAAWRGKPPNSSIFAKSADRLLCLECYSTNVDEPHFFSRAASVQKFKETMKDLRTKSASSMASDESAGSLQEFCKHAHRTHLEELISRDAVLEAVPCPFCLRQEDVPPFCFDRREFILSFRAEALKKSRTATVQCSTCEAMGRVHNLSMCDVVVPDVYLSFHWGVLNKQTSTHSTQMLVASLQPAIEQGADVSTWYDVGSDPSEEMHQGVSKSIVVIIFLSDAYCGSKRCIAEYLQAIHTSRYLIPVLVPGKDADGQLDAGWTGPGAEDKDWWHHATVCSSCQDPRTGKRFSWSALAQFQPIDMRVKARADAKEAKRVQGAAVTEIVKRIQSRFHTGEHVQQMNRMYLYWKKAALFDTFEANREDTVKLKEEAAALFDKLDLDKDGHIDKFEILTGFPQLDEKTAEILLAEVDVDGDGNISFEEFWVAIQGLLAQQ